MKTALTLALAIAFYVSPVLAFECSTMNSDGESTLILKGQWNSDRDVLQKLTIVENRRASLLFQDSLYEVKSFHGVYQFQNQITNSWDVDPTKEPTFWEKIFNDGATVDPYYGKVVTRHFDLGEHKEFQWYSVHFSVPRAKMNDSSFKAKFYVTFHGYLDEENSKKRTPIKDKLICVQ